MKRILFLAYHFPPLGGAGVQRALKLTCHLPALGYEPVVVTGHGTSFDEWSPADHTMLAEIPPGTDVRRTDSPQPASTTGRRRRTEKVLGIQSKVDRWWSHAALTAGGAVESVDLVLGELVPYSTARPAAELSRLHGVPWVADLQDPWALDEMELYPSVLHRRLELRRMRHRLATASAIVMNTAEAGARLEHSFPELAKRVVVIPNGFDPSDFAAEIPKRSDGRFRIVHAGHLHTETGLRNRRTERLRRLLGGMPVVGIDFLTRSHIYLLEAVQRLIGADPALAATIEVHLAGLLSTTDRFAAARSCTVHQHGYLPHNQAVALVRSADLLFLPMHDLPPGTRAGLVPGKTYEYLASGRPILAAVPDGDARDLLAEAGNTILCRPNDVGTMERAIAGELRRWRTAQTPRLPHADLVARFDRRRHAEDFVAMFDALLRVPS